MDTQNISVAAGVLSAAVAALGLLLTWYRREEKEERKSSNGRALSKRARVRLFAAVAVGIVVLAAGGVVLTFKVGATGGKNSGVSATLTATQYRGRLGRICSDAKERMLQIDQTGPTKTVLGLEATGEQDEVGAIRRLAPPNELTVTHANMIAVWDRRVSILKSLSSHLAQLSNNEFLSGSREADHLAVELAKIVQSLRVPECDMTG